jgi:hypothetical protein
MGRNVTSRPIDILIWIFLIGVVGFVLLIVIPEIGLVEKSRRMAARSSAAQVAVAVKQYVSEYGFRPGDNEAQIMTTLRGENTRKIVFFEVPDRSLNTKGELIDLWGTPFRFDLSDAQNPRVWSCGKDRRDDGGAEGSDDITRWR